MPTAYIYKEDELLEVNDWIPQGWLVKGRRAWLVTASDHASPHPHPSSYFRAENEGKSRSSPPHMAVW